MTASAISVENLGKRYVIGHQKSKDDGLRHALEQLARAPARWFQRGSVRATRPAKREFWALRDVSFDVKPGEVLGIVGRNGAGKSTLLKLLSRITAPTEGRIQLEGRVASLLEVGTGFHPELTGRENIFLNGAILGMTRVEIKRKFDEIVAFSEVEKFLDTPVKRYSSGMYVRLAFAVAAHLEPEILIVDEVLAVGDAQFQKKCLGKMRDVSARSGRTVLFVSHNMGALANLCDSACWLEKGRVRQVGPTRSIINDYLTQNGPSRDRVLPLASLPRTSGGDGRLKLTGIEWLSDFPLRHGEPMRARIDFETYSAIEDVTIGLGFANIEGTRLLTYDSDFVDGTRPTLRQPGRHSVVVTIDSLPLAPGVFNLDLGGKSSDNHSLDYLPGAAQLEVIPGPSTPGSIVRPDGGVRLSGGWSWDIAEEPAVLPA
ncbi:MAG TPA: ABC transporter ATP-binding protein [Opitutaceae bacterium]|nr:ABC transporter ATP-binding protein [Opitutaceae bacterium]